MRLTQRGLQGLCGGPVWRQLDMMGAQQDPSAAPQCERSPPLASSHHYSHALATTCMRSVLFPCTHCSLQALNHSSPPHLHDLLHVLVSRQLVAAALTHRHLPTERGGGGGGGERNETTRNDMARPQAVVTVTRAAREDVFIDPAACCFQRAVQLD